MISNHENMVWQWDWAGTSLVNKRVLVSVDELDEPQEQLRTIILPPDPPPVIYARPENYSIDEQPVSTRYTADGAVRIIWHPQGRVIERIVTVPGNLSD
jgi:hypothetical protein